MVFFLKIFELQSQNEAMLSIAFASAQKNQSNNVLVYVPFYIKFVDNKLYNYRDIDISDAIINGNK